MYCFISGCILPLMKLWMSSKGFGFYLCDQFENDHWIAVYATEKRLEASRDRLTHFSIACKVCVCLCVFGSERVNESGGRRTRRGQGCTPEATWAPDKVGYNVTVIAQTLATRGARLRLHFERVTTIILALASVTPLNYHHWFSKKKKKQCIDALLI